MPAGVTFLKVCQVSIAHGDFSAIERQFTCDPTAGNMPTRQEEVREHAQQQQQNKQGGAGATYPIWPAPPMTAIRIGPLKLIVCQCISVCLSVCVSVCLCVCTTDAVL